MAGLEGMLDLSQTLVDPGEIIQFHLYVKDGTACPETILVTATTLGVEPITTSLELIPPPMAEIIVLSQLPAPSNTPVQFSSTEEYTTYRWEIGSRVYLERDITHIFPASGTHEVYLQVMDFRKFDSETEARELVSETVITVVIQNQGPVISTVTHITGNAGDCIRFDTSESSDPDGRISAYDWNIGWRNVVVPSGQKGDSAENDCASPLADGRRFAPGVSCNHSRGVPG